MKHNREPGEERVDDERGSQTVSDASFQWRLVYSEAVGHGPTD